LDIKDIIRKRRLELGLAYEELGKMVGVGKSTVQFQKIKKGPEDFPPGPIIIL
jgi:predicted transcriptional regulator